MSPVSIISVTNNVVPNILRTCIFKVPFPWMRSWSVTGLGDKRMAVLVVFMFSSPISSPRVSVALGVTEGAVPVSCEGNF